VNGPRSAAPDHIKFYLGSQSKSHKVRLATFRAHAYSDIVIDVRTSVFVSVRCEEQMLWSNSSCVHEVNPNQRRVNFRPGMERCSGRRIIVEVRIHAIEDTKNEEQQELKNHDENENRKMDEEYQRMESNE
jgi:hypothetical protein